jgi:hypothetical protein
MTTYELGDSIGRLKYSILRSVQGSRTERIIIQEWKDGEPSGIFDTPSGVTTTFYRDATGDSTFLPALDQFLNGWDVENPNRLKGELPLRGVECEIYSTDFLNLEEIGLPKFAMLALYDKFFTAGSSNGNINIS